MKISSYSKVYQQFWAGSTGRKLRTAGPCSQLVALYLISNPRSSWLGIYHMPIPIMAFETGMSIEGASEALQSTIEAGFCKYHNEAEVVWIPEMARFQIGEQLHDKDLRIKGVRNDVESMHNMPFINEFIEKYGKPFRLGIEAPPKPLQGTLDAPSKPIALALSSAVSKLHLRPAGGESEILHEDDAPKVATPKAPKPKAVAPDDDFHDHWYRIREFDGILAKRSVKSMSHRCWVALRKEFGAEDIVEWWHGVLDGMRDPEYWPGFQVRAKLENLRDWKDTHRKKDTGPTQAELEAMRDRFIAEEAEAAAKHEALLEKLRVQREAGAARAAARAAEREAKQAKAAEADRAAQAAEEPKA